MLDAGGGLGTQLVEALIGHRLHHGHAVAPPPGAMAATQVLWRAKSLAQVAPIMDCGNTSTDVKLM